jgi:hypothetical protein
MIWQNGRTWHGRRCRFVWVLNESRAAMFCDESMQNPGGPASVCLRKSSSRQRSRIALTGPALRRASRLMVRLFGQSVR